MDPKRKKKLQDRKARQAKLPQRRPSARSVSGKEASFLREVGYIVQRAREGDSRCVTLGPLVLFSTESGDAWLLDPEDSLALCLARDGDAEPVRIMETDANFSIEWDRIFFMDDECFTTVVKKTGRIATVLGYPTQAIREAIARATKFLS
jgi:hypothetical protein